MKDILVPTDIPNNYFKCAHNKLYKSEKKFTAEKTLHETFMTSLNGISANLLPAEKYVYE